MNIILGKSNTGKSTYIFDKIIEDIKKNKKVILFVPSQCRMLTEENYINANNLNGIIGLNITTINEYINEKLKSSNLHINDKYISEIDRKIIVSKCLNDKIDSLKIFKNAAKKTGFLDILDMYIDIFNKQLIDPNLNCTFNDSRLDAKFNDILTVYSRYKDEMENKYIDSVSALDILLKDGSFSEDIKKCNIYFDEYNNFSIKELEFIKKLEEISGGLTITLDTDISNIEDIYSGNTSEIYEVTNNTFKSLLKIANDLEKKVDIVNLYENHLKAKEDIKLIANNYFGHYNKKIEVKNVYIYAQKNMYDEIEKVANIISENIKSKKYRFNDFCIYTSNVEKYIHVIRNVMQKYDINTQVSTKTSVNESKLCIYIRLLLDIAKSNFNIDNIISILKLGLNDILIDDICMLENYVKEFNISGYNIDLPFYLNNEVGNNKKVYDLDPLNNIREKILQIFDIKNKVTANMDVGKIISIIYGHLIDNNILNNWNKFLQDEYEVNLYEINDYNIQVQVWDKICDIFDSMYKVYGEDKITIESFYDMFSILTKNTFIKSVPATLDQVIVADVNGTRVGKKKICFFIGVNEDEFPKKDAEDPVFKDIDLEKIEQSGIKLKETTISKLNMQMFNLYKAMNNVTDRLYFMFESSSLDGKSLNPSSIIKRLKNISDISVIGNVSKNDEELDINNIYSNEKAFYYAVKLLEEVENGNTDKYDELLLLYDCLLKHGNNTALEYKKDDGNLNNNTLDMLYSNNINTSISKLELFKKCPFSYYMKYILKVDKPNGFDITNLDTGNFLHSVIEEFSKYLFINGIYYHEILDLNEKIKEEYDKVLMDIVDSNLNECFRLKKTGIKYEVLRLKLIKTIKKVISVIAKSFNQSDFVPYGYEIEFSSNGEFKPIVIDLGNGKSVNIVGKIDRVDILENKDKTYVRVIDYKSSSRELDIKDIKEGISLQLITYIDALRENKGFLPAAMLYFNLSDRLVNLKEYIDDDEKIKAEVIKSLRMKGIFLKDLEIIHKMDKKVDSTAEKLIDISSSSVTKGSNKTLDEKEFNSLCMQTKNILRNLSNQVIQGVVKIDPNLKANYCKHCNYYSICRKNSNV